MSQEQEWAHALKRARQTTTQIKTSIQTQREDILLQQMTEQMDYYKMKFLEATKQNNLSQTRALAEKLVNTHARMTALVIKQEKNKGIPDNSPIIERHLTKYFTDCKILLKFLPEN